MNEVEFYDHISRYKRDQRPPRGGWSDGEYMCCCVACGCGFYGDKRSLVCADCAYCTKPSNLQGVLQ